MKFETKIIEIYSNLDCIQSVDKFLVIFVEMNLKCGAQLFKTFVLLKKIIIFLKSGNLILQGPF